MTPPFPDDLIDDLNARFEHEEPREILRWALVDSDLERVAVASSFQAEGTCVIDMAAKLRPEVPILFLETGFHFAETLAFREQLAERLALNVVDLVGEHTVESQAATFGERLYERGGSPRSGATPRRVARRSPSSSSTSSSRAGGC